MSYRKLIYPFSLVAFLPAVFLFIVGVILIPMIVFLDVSKGHWGSIIYLLPFIGGGLGLVAAILVTLDIAGDSVGNIAEIYKKLGLLGGIASEVSVIIIFTPTLEPFLIYWLPQLIGGLVLLALSFKYTANKLSQQDAASGAAA